MSKLFRFFLRLFGVRCKSGKMTVVVSGTKTIKITTGYEPKEVWINLGRPKGIPVCHAEMDYVDVRIVPDGFVIIVKLTSEYREIQWIARGKK